mmetsp:Transcript_24427/g.55744  ORF Transcript_24427/g.55744 Transcript_24427/m.55744 type:complete len:90 (+) Transcript_24427:55-324(+)
MVYIDSDGNVISKRSPWRMSLLADIFWAVANGIGFFFRSITGPPPARRSTYSERQRRTSNASGSGGGRPRANIRGMSNLGSAKAPPAGG